MWYSSAIVLCDVCCEWAHEYPRYRLFVNNELFVERRWIWKNEYLEEMISIWVNPGDYEIKYQVVGGSQALLDVKNLRIVQGPQGALTINDRILRIPTPE